MHSNVWTALVAAAGTPQPDIAVLVIVHLCLIFGIAYGLVKWWSGRKEGRTITAGKVLLVGFGLMFLLAAAGQRERDARLPAGALTQGR